MLLFADGGPAGDPLYLEMSPTELPIRFTNAGS